MFLKKRLLWYYFQEFLLSILNKLKSLFYNVNFGIHQKRILNITLPFSNTV